MEAQRFPLDYDGIIAGAPAHFFTHASAGFIASVQATEADPTSYIPASKLPAIESAALAACDELDGLKDGLIDDPRKCHFEPGMLLCQTGIQRLSHAAADRSPQEALRGPTHFQGRPDLSRLFPRR
jgi:feruloyl esterase